MYVYIIYPPYATVTGDLDRMWEGQKGCENEGFSEGCDSWGV